MSSSEKQSNPNGPTVKHSVYPSITMLGEGVTYAIGNTPYMDVQIIPIDATMGYESLTHKVPVQSSTYFDINDAYPAVEKAQCTEFVLRKCDGRVDNRYITDELPAKF
jgi:hypothetical protein